MKIASLFGGSAERTSPLNEQIESPESRYHWWFDHPVDWERPTQTLYVTGWCVSARGKDIFAIRARVGRRKFLGNYGIERKDVGATLRKAPAERIGFAIAVPLQRGKSQVTIEVQEWDGVWRPISSCAVFGTSMGDSQAPIDPRYFIHNPDPNPRIEFWLDRPLVWPKKFATSRLPAGVSRFPATKLPKYVRVCERTFSRRVSVRSDRTSVLESTIDQAHRGAVFHSRRSLRLDAASLFWKRAAINGPGRLFSYIRCAARFSDGHWMRTQNLPVIAERLAK